MRRVARYLWPLPYLVLLGTVYSVFVVTADDPYITYRYAANILSGNGPVYNVGERVEGFSSPLHLLLCVLLLKIAPAADILFKAKLAGLICACVALFQTGLLARRAGLTAGGAILAQLLVAGNLNFALAAVNGLETTLYGVFVLASALAFVRERRGGVASAGWLVLALLTRPDAAGLFAALLLVRLVWARRRGLPVRDTLRWAGVFLLAVVFLLCARLAYYGQPFPNTYYAKNVPLARGWSDGWLYLSRALAPWNVGFRSVWTPKVTPTLQFLSTVSLLFWGLAVLGLWRTRGRMTGQAMAALTVAVAAFILRFGGDWMDGWRFVAPILPVLAVLQCHGLKMLTGARRGRRLRLTAAYAAALIVWGAAFRADPHASWGTARFSTRGRDLLRATGPLGRKWVANADDIQRRFPRGATLAYSEMGYAGYTNRDKTFWDTRGITDPEIARLPARYKGTWGVNDLDWSRPGDPLYAILAQRQPDGIIAFAYKDVPPVVLERYRLVAVISGGDPTPVIIPALVYSRLPNTPSDFPIGTRR